MNYDRIPELRASEQDADDQLDEGAQNGVGGTDGAQDQDDDADDQAGDAPDDQADDNDADDSQEDDDQLNAQDQTQRRRAIERRAASQSSREDFDPAGFAAQTAAQTARAMANETAFAQQRAEEARQEREALAAMTEEQRATYLLAKETQQLKAGSARTELLLRSNSDQVAFGRTLARKPEFAKYENEVERRHQAILAQGGYTDRSTILAHLIGERALKAENKGNQQKQSAQRRVQNQRNVSTGRGGRGDAGGNANQQNRSNLVARMERDDPVI